MSITTLGQDQYHVALFQDEQKHGQNLVLRLSLQFSKLIKTEAAISSTAARYQMALVDTFNNPGECIQQMQYHPILMCSAGPIQPYSVQEISSMLLKRSLNTEIHALPTS